MNEEIIADALVAADVLVEDEVLVEADVVVEADALLEAEVLADVLVEADIVDDSPSVLIIEVTNDVVPVEAEVVICVNITTTTVSFLYPIEQLLSITITGGPRIACYMQPPTI